MTRFEKEISGALGEYWERSAEKEVEELVAHCDEAAELDENGAIRWKSNGNYLPEDCCEKLVYACYDFDVEATRKAREEQLHKHAEEYKKSMLNMSNEARAELEYEIRAAFGPGTKVVNVITGDVYNT